MFSKLVMTAVAIATAVIVFIYLKNPYAEGPSATQSSSLANGTGTSGSASRTIIPTNSSSDGSAGSSAKTGAKPSDGSNAENPFGLKTDADSDAASDVGDSLDSSAATGSSPDSGQSADATLLGLPLAEVGLQQWGSDVQFDAMVSALDADPALLDSLLEQYQLTSDPLQLKQLTQLLGRFDNARVAEVAGEIARFGSTDNRLAALDLLRQVHPGNPQARDVLLDIIGTEQDASVLSRALNSIAVPTEVSYDHRQSILGNAQALVTHADPIVRARSFGILADWTDTDQLTPLILTGLNDPDPRVRQKTTSSLLAYPYTDRAVTDSLFAIAENTTEERRTRRAALQALRQGRMSDAEQLRFNSASDSVNRSPNR